MQPEIESVMSERTIGRYLDALSSGAPAPGGGSAAGLAGALGCALGSMVCNLTLIREHDEAIAEQQRTFVSLQKSMLAQAQADERVFSAYRAAASLPRGTAEEKQIRRDAIERTLVAAAEVPLELVTLGLEALAVMHSTAAVGTSHAVGDLLTGGYLLQAMTLGSIENIEANARLMKQPANRERFQGTAAPARTDLSAAMASLESAVAMRRNG